jgi:hypothetical protein
LTFAATNTTASITSISLAGSFKQVVEMVRHPLLVEPPLVVLLQRLRAVPSLRQQTCAMSQISMMTMFRSDLSAAIISS